MTEQDRIDILQAKIIERELETPLVATGIPGVCMAGMVAPDCVEVAQWLTNDPYVYCLN